MTEAPEIEWSQSHAPRSVQPITVLETLQELTSGTINVHEAKSRAVGFKARTFLVEHIGDDNIVADGLHVKRHIVVRQVLIHERIFSGAAVIMIVGVFVEVLLAQVDQVKCVVINIHAAFGKVCRVQEAVAFNESARQARVAGSVGSLDQSHCLRGRRRGALSYSDSWIPSSNRSVNRGEEERRRFASGQQEICLTAVGDGAGRCT